MDPPSTVATQTDSTVFANFASSALSSLRLRRRGTSRIIRGHHLGRAPIHGPIINISVPEWQLMSWLPPASRSVAPLRHPAFAGVAPVSRSATPRTRCPRGALPSAPPTFSLSTRPPVRPPPTGIGRPVPVGGGRTVDICLLNLLVHVRTRSVPSLQQDRREVRSASSRPCPESVVDRSHLELAVVLPHQQHVTDQRQLCHRLPQQLDQFRVSHLSLHERRSHFDQHSIHRVRSTCRVAHRHDLRHVCPYCQHSLAADCSLVSRSQRPGSPAGLTYSVTPARHACLLC
jgi:hypothetical protein